MKKQLIVLIGCSAMLSSCNLYKSYERPEGIIVSDSLYRNTAAPYAILDGDTTNFGNTPWQQVFVEPELQTLINKALAQNTDIRTADLTIQQAEAALKVSRLAYLPALTFSPQGTLSSYDGAKATQVYNIPVQASWQLGALGSIRNTKKQYEASLEQSKAYKQVARTSIIAAVANMYYTLQMLDEQLATTTATIALWKKNVAAMESMYEAGGMGITGAAVAQSKANLYQIESTVPALEEGIVTTENALCAILHETPHAVTRGKFNAENFPADMAAGVPLQLLSNRPDVKAAEMQLAYAFYGTNIARSNFYPSLTISGTAGWTNNGGMGIVNPGKVLTNAVASLVQPLFNRGALTANLKINKLKQEQATLQFEQVLLNAGQEVSNSLTAYQSCIAQEQSIKKQVGQLEKAVEETNFLFTHGNTTSYLETLTAQQSLLSARLSLISQKFDKVQAAISLYQALGGGREM